MKSMTGFGKAECLTGNKKWTVEIRTLNSKQSDLTIKTPVAWKNKELEIRNELINSLQRGKIELHITMDEAGEEMITQFNENAIKRYYQQLSDFAERNHIPMPPDILNHIIQIPNVLIGEHQEPNENDWQILREGIRGALVQVNNFREQEGRALMEDIANRIKLIESYTVELEKIEPHRIEIIKERLQQNLIEYVGENTVDQNRFEQELIYYLEKIDVNEEKVRLRNHCSYFLSTMTEGDGVGKKLGFIAQEMGREINTIGSKANNAEIQIFVIQMKDELEKIKEQIMNVL